MKSLMILMVSAAIAAVPAIPLERNVFRESLSGHNAAIRRHHAAIISLSEEVLALKGRLAWNDIRYINSVLQSTNMIGASLFYQLELGDVYLDVAGVNEAYVRSSFPRMAGQARFTQSQLQIEFERILFQYAQILDLPALALIEKLRIEIKATLAALDEYIDWLQAGERTSETNASE